jgi:hypothetical protein
MPTKTRPAPKPVATLFNDGNGAIVTKTHDVEAARDALLENFQTNLRMDDDEALEALETYLFIEPTLEHGRWVMAGNDESRYWREAPADGRGVTRAVVWYL